MALRWQSVLGQPKSHLHVAGANGLFEPCRVLKISKPCVAVRGGKALVKQHETIRPIEHQIAGLNVAHLFAVRGQTLGEIVKLNKQK